jgi:hypothetical protein
MTNTLLERLLSADPVKNEELTPKQALKKHQRQRKFWKIVSIK